jgi:hypothetical protein
MRRMIQADQGRAIAWHRVTPRWRSLRNPIAVVLVALAVAAVFQLLPTFRELSKASRSQSLDQSGLRRNAAGQSIGVYTSFGDWVARRIPANAAFWIEPKASRRQPSIYQWLTFRLSPRLHAPTPESADVIVYYDKPTRPGPRPGFESLEVFRPHFALMRRRKP